jgi:Protein of unknown function (DUF3237)
MPAMDHLELPPPSLTPLLKLSVDVGSVLDLGGTAFGRRRMVSILGGTFAGALGQGRILPGGADWQLVVQDGTAAHLDARYVLAFDDGAQVYVHNTALRVATAEVSAALMRGEVVPDAAVYFRCQPRFETAAPRLAWLMQRQFIGTAVRRPASVHLSFFTVE